MFIRRRKPWDVSSNDITAEAVWKDRRRFLAQSLSIGAGLALAGGWRISAEDPKGPAAEKYPAKKNEKYALDRPLTDEKTAGSYNNFYEFSTDKEQAGKLAQKLTTEPWQVECAGLVNKPKTWEIADLVKAFELEERTYRHRCVEAWSMAIPWTGFPLKALIDKLEPQSKAKYVRFISFNRPSEAPGMADPGYPFPYYEALTIEEATNELAFVVTGSYGHPLAKQHGAPIDIRVPWKYGYKSPKSIVKIELVETKPKTFWNDLIPNEYGFESNVDPAVPHPRWSQARERFFNDKGKVEERATLKFNGYGDSVAALYK